MSFALVLLFAGLGLFCLAIAPLFDTGILVFDLLSHFPLQAGLTASGLFVLSLPWWRRPVVRWGLITLLCAALGNGAWFYPYWPKGSLGSGRDERVLSIAQLNVQRLNRQFDRTVDWVRRLKPDIFVILEVDNRWLNALSQLDGLYPYRVIHPRNDNFGLAVYSRYPIQDRREIRLPMYPAPAYLLRLNVSGRTVRLGAFHTVPPQSQELVTARNLGLDVIGKWAAEEPATPTFVVGDLNTTPFAAPYRRYIGNNGLEDSRLGQGLFPTWPAAIPAIARIPLDYIVHNRHIRTISLNNGPAVGSDHLPVVGKFILAK